VTAQGTISSHLYVYNNDIIFWNFLEKNESVLFFNSYHKYLIKKIIF